MQRHRTELLSALLIILLYLINWFCFKKTKFNLTLVVVWCIYLAFAIFFVPLKLNITKLKALMTDPKYKCILKELEFPTILLIICWIFNLVECFLSHSDKIHFADIFTLRSFVFTLITTLVIKFLNNEKK